MNKNILLLLTLVFPLSLPAQNIERVLSEIENNNTTLRAYRNLNEAQRLENKTDIYLENPEIGFNYLWGDPSSMGTRQDFSVSQSFYFPTAYGLKKKIADARNIQSDLQFQFQRKSVLYEAKLICNELIYLNALYVVLEKRANHANDIAKAYNTRFEKGEINILDNNKARFNYLNAQKELEANETERNVLLARLAAMNGGIAIDFNQSSFPIISLPVDFESWYKENELKNLNIQRATNDIEIGAKEIKLSKALSLPKFSGGYMSESVVGESFKGISVGMSIPLWENKNKVKLANAQQEVSMEIAKDARLQSYNQLKGTYDKAQSLLKTLNAYREALQSVNSSDLLMKALEAGELSLIEYMMELTLYYETTDKFLSVENELNQLATALYFYEL